MIESHVTSLELSRKLHELGVNKPSIYYWHEGNDINDEGHEVYRLELLNYQHSYLESYAAYLSSELLPILPKKIANNDCHERYLYIDTSLDYTLYYFEDVDNQSDENFANAIAKMLIYLIENGYVKVEDLNK